MMPSEWMNKVVVFVKKEDKLLIGKRILSSDNFTYIAPSGGVDFGETLEEAAKRETLEEIGVRVKNLRKISNKPLEISWYEEKNSFLHRFQKVRKRMEKYQGVRTSFFEADFDCYDNSLLNNDGDAMEIVEFTKEEFIRYLEEETFFPEYMKFQINLVKSL